MLELPQTPSCSNYGPGEEGALPGRGCLVLTPKPDAHGARRFSPAPGWFAERARKGEPRNASYFTAAIVLSAMSIINPTFSLLAAGVVTAIYFVLMKRRLAADDSERYASNAPKRASTYSPCRQSSTPTSSGNCATPPASPACLRRTAGTRAPWRNGHSARGKPSGTGQRPGRIPWGR